jgi:hypothetical protein
MSDQNPTPPSNNPGGFSVEYVKELRDEAASWRTKCREMETKATTLEAEVSKVTRGNAIQSELQKRGIKADPSFIKVAENQKIEDAVDSFLKDYPQFASSAPSPRPNTPSPMPANKPNSNTPNVVMSDYAAVKADPIARAKLRDQYRFMLSGNSDGLKL